MTYKTAYYSFHLPVALAMHMCNVPEVYTIRLPSQETKVIRPYDLALSILLPLGEYFQIQDDYINLMDEQVGPLLPLFCCRAVPRLHA